MARSKDKTTSSKVASEAAKVLANPKTSRVLKSVAGSALSQKPSKKKKVAKKPGKKTSKKKSAKKR